MRNIMSDAIHQDILEFLNDSKFSTPVFQEMIFKEIHVCQTYRQTGDALFIHYIYMSFMSYEVCIALPSAML